MNEQDVTTPVRTSKLFKALAILFLLLQIMIIALIIHMGFGSRKGKPVGGEGRNLSVEVFEVRPARVQDVVEIPARIEAWNSVEISAEVAGMVVEHGAKEGDKVEKGRLLLKIDDRTYAAKKMKAEADILKAEADMKRTQKLFEAKSLSEKDLDVAKSARALAESELIIAKSELEDCEIRSPIGGYLDDLSADVGECVVPGKQIAAIYDVDKVKLVIGVPEKAVRAVKPGLEMDFIADDGKVRKAKVVFLATAAENASLTFKAELEVDNTDMYFRPGMIVKVKIIRRVIEDALMVPLKAIIPKYGSYYVYVAGKDDKASLKEIKIDFVTGFSAVVSAGLSAGDRIVCEGQHLIRENEQLRILNSPAGAGDAVK
ncbi:MAG TPA: hypothetical protein DCZ94_01245 [Lentisphaeria bacterium]|nr:MAG: hypothetical protein A2X48_11535 [Lentisphaerae bacterium GWF2_49_21]HBC85556.1 hypothetical protein [Lentisphaeria bacterium]